MERRIKLLAVLSLTLRQLLFMANVQRVAAFTITNTNNLPNLLRRSGRQALVPVRVRVPTRDTTKPELLSRNNIFRLFGSSLSLGPIPSNNSNNNEGEGGGRDDLSKWERMYNENAPKGNGAGSGGDLLLRSEVRVVSFDLDNTIWKTSAVINSANDALANHMTSTIAGMDPSIRVEKVMGTLFKSDKAKYCPVSAQDVNGNGSEIESENGNTNLDHIKAPTLLTQLRKDAIMEVLKNHTTEQDPEIFVEEAFQVWTNARHDAIPLNFASSVIKCLNEIRQLKTKNGNDVVVGAITDGNSDPRKVNVLRDYFDFVVNAERVGISKPDRRIYDAAIQHVSSEPSLNHVFENLEEGAELDVLLDRIGPWWIHIGDDFVKDIVACKDVNMRSIWSRELVMDKLKLTSSSTSSIQDDKSEPPTTTTRTENDLKKDISENKTLRMMIGTEDYVLDSIQAEFADAVVDNFGEVCKVISTWHEEGLESKITRQNEVDLPDYFSIVLPDEDDDEEEKGIDTNEKEGTDMNMDQKQQTTNEVSISSDVKFCIMCGEKLPIQAKFCSSCGNKQPEFKAS